MKYKKIDIIPSAGWWLDVWVTKDKPELAKKFSAMYGASYDYYMDEIHINSVMTVNSTDSSQSKGCIVFIMILGSMEKFTAAHEIVHVMWRLHREIGYEMNYDSQEWQACMFEHLFRETLSPKGYQKL